MKVACNLKGVGMLSYSVNQGELDVLHDVYHAAVEPGSDKATYGNTLQELLTLSLKAFHSYSVWI